MKDTVMLRKCCFPGCDVVYGCYINGVKNDCKSCPSKGDCEIKRTTTEASHGMCDPHFERKMKELKKHK